MLNTIVNKIIVQEVRRALEDNADFMRHRDGYLDSPAFMDSTLFKANGLGMSVNSIVAEILTANGCGPNKVVCNLSGCEVCGT